MIRKKIIVRYVEDQSSRSIKTNSALAFLFSALAMMQSNNRKSMNEYHIQERDSLEHSTVAHRNGWPDKEQRTDSKKLLLIMTARSQESGVTFPSFWRRVVVPKQNGKYKLWVYFMLFWAVYSSFFTPIEFGFFRGLPAHLVWFDLVGQVMFLFDIVMTFFVAYKDRLKYNWVIDHRKIALRYIKSNFILDLLSCLPWDIIYKASGDKEIVRYFLWVRLYRVRKVTSFFHRLEQDIRINYLFTRIVKLITVELYCTHTAACIFYYLATTLPPSRERFTWIGSLTLGGYTFENFRQIDLGRRYVVSLYFAIVTMATVGYGDIHAVNTREMVFVMIFVSFDMILGAYLIGNMTALIVKGSSTEKFRDGMTALIKYMNRNQLERDLRSQMKSHLRLQYECQFVEDSIVEDLPLSIRAKISQSLYLNIIERIGMFKGCSSEFSNQIATRVHEEYFLPGEVIIEQGSAVDQVYFVEYGTLEEVLINLDGSEKVIGSLEPECVFGEIAVLCHIPQPYTVRVCELCKVLRIDKQTLLNIMQIYFIDGRQVLNNLLKSENSDNKIKQLESDIAYLITEQEVELALKVNSAAYNGQFAHVKNLMKGGADPNKSDYDGRTPLHLAAFKGHDDIVSFLLQEGAKIDAEDNFGNTPLIEAVKGRHNHVARILREAGAQLADENAGNHLRMAVLNGNLEFVRSLLDIGIDPNLPDHNGRTALHIAASEGLTLMAKLLVAHGGDIHAKDRWGKTPIHESRQFGARMLEKIFDDAQEECGSATSSNTIVQTINGNTGTREHHCDKEGRRKRCTIFNGPPWIEAKERQPGLVIRVPESIDILLQMASNHFGYTYTCALNEDAGQILFPDLIEDSEKVFVIK